VPTEKGSEQVVINDFDEAQHDCPFRFAMADPKCQASRCMMWRFDSYELPFHKPPTIKITGFCSLTRGK